MKAKREREREREEEKKGVICEGGQSALGCERCVCERQRKTYESFVE